MRRTDEDWSKSFDVQRNSGSCTAKFCESDNLTLSSFHNARHRITGERIECTRSEKPIANGTDNLSFISSGKKVGISFNNEEEPFSSLEVIKDV